MDSEVLILAPAFPPSAESGVYRTLKFVKYLGLLGWRSVVVTPSQDAYPFLDAGLAEEIPREIVVYRTRFPGLARAVRDWLDPSAMGSAAQGDRRRRAMARVVRRLNVLVIPDVYVTWLPFAVLASVRARRRHRPGVVLASAPPSSVAVIGAVVSRLLSLPLVIDFRDGWTVEPFYRGSGKPGNALRYWLEGKLERLVFRRARYVICQQSVMACDYARKYPIWREKLVVLNNGFDEDDFKEVKPFRFDRPTLLHTGYVEDRRNPEVFFRALALLRMRRRELLERFQVVFVGRVRADYPRLAAEIGVGDVVRFWGHVDHRTALSMMLGASALLLLTGRHPSELPGKLFEYLGSRRPVFGLAVPGGEAARVIEMAEAGVVAVGEDPGEVARALEDFLERVVSGGWNPGSVDLSRFTRRAATEALAGLLERVVVQGEET
ncbi:MAG: glycosyltransferase [Gemmatimonadetes bacterium]|nr:glycosyltransferase [Gemmatimonadota bacterium]